MPGGRVFAAGSIDQTLFGPVAVSCRVNWLPWPASGVSRYGLVMVLTVPTINDCDCTLVCAPLSVTAMANW